MAEAQLRRAAIGYSLRIPTAILATGTSFIIFQYETFCRFTTAAIAQLGERQTEDLKVPGSIPGLGIDSFGHSHICFSMVNILQLLLHPFFLCLSLSLSPSLLLAYIHVLLFHSFAKLQCALEMQSSGHMV